MSSPGSTPEDQNSYLLLKTSGTALQQREMTWSSSSADQRHPIWSIKSSRVGEACTIA